VGSRLEAWHKAHSETCLFYDEFDLFQKLLTSPPLICLFRVASVSAVRVSVPQFT